MPKCQYQLTNY